MGTPWGLAIARNGEPAMRETDHRRKVWYSPSAHFPSWGLCANMGSAGIARPGGAMTRYSEAPQLCSNGLDLCPGVVFIRDWAAGSIIWKTEATRPSSAIIEYAFDRFLRVESTNS